MTASLSARGITKVFPDGTAALHGVTFSLEAGKTLVLLGPSGCGKSTLLRIVAGLEEPTEGTVELDGTPFGSTPPGARDVGFVFQSYALYPHLTVFRNLSLGLEVRKVPRGEIERRVHETAVQLGIEALLARRPSQLSGGQQQRVALGRALVRRPRLYLLDEPLSNLDATLREETRGELKALFRSVSATVVYVTHDQAEAMSLADEVLVMEKGLVRQAGPPLEIYSRPTDLFTAGFVGSPRMNLWPGRRDGGDFVGRGIALTLPQLVPSGADVVVGIRPENVEVSAVAPSGLPSLPAAVETVELLGDRAILSLKVGEERLRAVTPAREVPPAVFVSIPRDRLHVFDAASGMSLRPPGGG